MLQYRQVISSPEDPELKSLSVVAFLLAITLGLSVAAQAGVFGESDIKDSAGAVQSRIRVEIDSTGPLFYVTGVPYKVNVSLSNLGKDEIKIDSFDLTWKSDKKIELDVKPDTGAPKTAAPGATAVAAMTVTFPDDAGGQLITLSGNARCGAAVHSQEIALQISPQLEVTLLPSRMLVDPRQEPKRIGMSVINHSDSTFEGNVKISASPGLIIAPADVESKIDPYGLEAYVFSVAADKSTAPGHYAVFIDIAGKTKDWAAVDVSYLAKKASDIKIDGDLKDWKDVATVPITRYVDGNHAFVGKAMFAYDDNNFYAAFDIDDKNHELSTDSSSRAKANPPSDTVVIAFDPLIDGAKAARGGYRADDVEFTVLGAQNGSVVLKTWAEAKPLEQEMKTPIAFRRDGSKSLYEVAIPWSECKSFKFGKDKMLAISVLVNDSDGSKVTQYEWGGGLAGNVDPRKFMPVVLTK